MTTQAAKTARSEVLCCETKTGLDGWSEVSGCLVSTHYKEPPCVILKCNKWEKICSPSCPTLRASNGTPFMSNQDYFSQGFGCFVIETKNNIPLSSK